MRRTSSTKESRFHALPTTPNGKRALLYMGVSLVAWAATPLAFIDPLRWVIWVFGWFGLAALLVSGFLALRAIIRDHDRAISLFAVVILVLWFLVSVPLILLAGGEA